MDAAALVAVLSLLGTLALGLLGWRATALRDAASVTDALVQRYNEQAEFFQHELKESREHSARLQVEIDTLRAKVTYLESLIPRYLREEKP